MKANITETDIKRQIKDYLIFSGWFNFHVLQGLGAYKGISDIIAIKNGIVLFIEVKTKHGKQSEHQINFQSQIEQKNGFYVLARSAEDVHNFIKKNLEKFNLISQEFLF